MKENRIFLFILESWAPHTVESLSKNYKKMWTLESCTTVSLINQYYPPPRSHFYRHFYRLRKSLSISPMQITVPEVLSTLPDSCLLLEAKSIVLDAKFFQIQSCDKNSKGTVAPTYSGPKEVLLNWPDFAEQPLEFFCRTFRRSFKKI